MSRLVDVPPQRVYGGVPLLLPLVKMSEAEATWLYGQPQIYDKDYPLDYDGTGLNPPWWAGTGAGGELNGLSGVGGGNVRLMPGEMGFGSLGLTAAQIKAQAAAATRKLAAQQKAAAKVTVAAKQSTATKQGTPATPKQPTATQQIAAAKKTCTTGGGVWDAINNICGKNPKQIACEGNGGMWSGNVCTPSAAYTACINANPPGTWANGSCTPGVSAAQQACAAMTPPGTFANGVCTPAAAVPVVCPAGQTLNATTNTCVANAVACGTPVTSCAPGLIIGTDANGCTVCVTDPNYNPQSAQIAQCQQGGGYWNGTYCAPPSSQAPYGGGGGGGFDPSIGGGAYPPPPLTDGSGGGLPMTQGQGGPGPQLNDQAFNIPTPDQSGSTDGTDQSSGDGSSDNSDTGSTDDTSKVADTNIFESISKLFSGMNGLACGCDAAPPWFNMGLGGNAPKMQIVAPSYYTAVREDPVKPSTTTAVVGAAVVLMVGAAAVFLWSKGMKR